ncbi:MAG TPA: ankyrin repeat domain-containing protein, partial [Verrucomicrobiae bacterium]|nr:ankyrin repeat domain-containing protein [Verrucomicrobiae bacterium]
MKTKLGVLIFLLAATVARAQTNNLTALLQQGLFEEQANRNLEAAIADYQALARQFDKDRAIAATAVFRLGECYRMQGKTNEAAAEYQRVLRDFPDQTRLADLSRQYLGETNVITSATTFASQVAIRIRLEELKASYAKLQTEVGRLKTLPPEQLTQELPTFASDNLLGELVSRLFAATQQLTVLKQNYSTNYPDVLREQTLIDVINTQIKDRETGILNSFEAQLKSRKAEISKLETELEAVSSANERSQTTGAANPDSAENQEIARIQTMIQNSPDLINAPEPMSSLGTPLIKVAYLGWLKAAAFLLEHGADVNGVATDLRQTSELQRAGKVTPLLAAVAAGNKAMTEFLIGHGANVNFKDSRGDTPLHLAANKGFQAVAEVLLASNADVNASDVNGMTPLHEAAINGNAKIVSLLLEHKADVNVPDSLGITPLMTAVGNKQPEIVKLLLAAGANPNAENKDGRTALSFAAEMNSPDMVKMLLDAKADPNVGKLDAPLLCAIHKGDVVSAELLLQAGANPNSTQEFELSPGGMLGRRAGGSGGQAGGISGRGGRGGMGGGFGGFGRQSITPLWLAVSEQQLPTVQVLLKYKADPNGLETDGRPVLFKALSDTNILKALLVAGANVDAIDPNGSSRNPKGDWTPLEAAASQNNAGSVQVLLEHGANPNTLDTWGQTPLHYAAFVLADEKVFSLLLDNKADPNVRNRNGQTPLDLLKQALRESVWQGRFPNRAVED